MVERLAELEQTKRDLEVGSPRFVTMAEEVERVARIVFRWSQLELQQARDAAPASLTTLTGVTPRPLDVILAAWREAQLRLEAAEPGSAESESAADDVVRLREEYRAAQQSLR